MKENKEPSSGLDPSDTNLLYNILLGKKKKDLYFDAWLIKSDCLVLSLNDFFICSFNDNELKVKYFAVKYPPCVHDSYFYSKGSNATNPTWTTVSNNTNANYSYNSTLTSSFGQGTYNYGSITLNTEDERNTKIILFPKDKAKKLLMLDSFKSDS